MKHGKEVKAEMSVKIPVKIGTKPVMLQADIVPNQVPLLMSRETMKKAGVIINTGNNTAKVFGEDVQLIQTSSGHLCLPLTSKLLVDDFEHSIVLNTSVLKDCTKLQKRQKAVKLHRQFSHATKWKLIRQGML